MSIIGIAVCGNSGIDYLQYPKDLHVFRSVLLLDGKEYEDFVDINADDFYKTLVETPDIPASTAQTSTGHILEMYERMRDQGFTEILVISISQKLSGTYQNAVLAAKMVEGVKVTVYDSQALTYIEAKMALRAYELAKKGKTVEQIIPELDAIQKQSHIFVAVDTLKYLVRGGRVSNLAGFVGNLLKLKPLLELTKDGKVETIEKIRTTTKARQTMIDKFSEEIKNFPDSEAFIAYTSNLADGEDIKKQLIESGVVKDVLLVPLTPVVGCHAGPGTIALGYVKK